MKTGNIRTTLAAETRAASASTTSERVGVHVRSRVKAGFADGDFHLGVRPRSVGSGG